MTSPGAPVFTRAQFVVEDGVRGMHQTQDNPTASLRRIGRQAHASSDPEQIVRNTLRRRDRLTDRQAERAQRPPARVVSLATLPP